MRNDIYKTWLVTFAAAFCIGAFLFVSNGANLAAFAIGAGITGINVLILGKGVGALLTGSRHKKLYTVLLLLKYTFLLTTLYVAVVILRLNPVPFAIGITVLPASVTVMAIYYMLRRQEHA